VQDEEQWKRSETQQVTAISCLFVDLEPTDYRPERREHFMAQPKNQGMRIANATPADDIDRLKCVRRSTWSTTSCVTFFGALTALCSGNIDVAVLSESQISRISFGLR
jgi:hypothetical protein